MIPTDYAEGQVPSSEFLFDLWIKQIYSRVHDGKFNYNGMTTGGNRTGKSMFSSNKLLILDPRFTVDDIVYTIDQFFDKVITITGVGKALLPDEIGILLSAREWYKVQSKAINFTIQTVGDRRPIIEFVAPDFSYLDNQPKKLMSQFSEISRRPYSDYARVKAFNIQIDRKKGKMYFHYPRFMIKDFGLVKMHRIKVVGTPPEEFVKEYEKKAAPYKKDLTKEMARLAKEKSSKEEGAMSSFLTQEDVEKQIMENPSHFKTRGKVDVSLIMHDFKIEGKKVSRDTAYEIKKVVERKLREEDEELDEKYDPRR